MLKRKLFAGAVAVSLMFPLSANAFFGSMFESMGKVAVAMVNGGTSVANNMIDGGTDVATSGIDTGGSVANNMIDEGGDAFGQMVELTSKLSDDIGLMANRILVMADKIGEMADRIVATEQMMADLTRDIATIAKGGNATSGSDSDAATIILNTANDTTASANNPPVIEISNGSSEYLLYVSNSILIDAKNMSPIAVHSGSPLDTLWSDIVSSISGDTLYIAVKTEASNISNVVRIKLD